MRDLTTIAAEEQELRTAMKHTALALANAEDRTRALLNEQGAQLAKLELLASEASEAFDRTRSVVSGPVADESPQPNGVFALFEPAEDAGVTAAFDRATTPQDGHATAAMAISSPRQRGETDSPNGNGEVTW